MSGKTTTEKKAEKFSDETAQKATQIYKEGAENLKDKSKQLQPEVEKTVKEREKFEALAQKKEEETCNLKQDQSNYDKQASALEGRAMESNSSPGVMDRIMGGLGHAKDSIVGALSSAKDTTQKTAHVVKEKISETMSDSSSKDKDLPKDKDIQGSDTVKSIPINTTSTYDKPTSSTSSYGKPTTTTFDQPTTTTSSFEKPSYYDTTMPGSTMSTMSSTSSESSPPLKSRVKESLASTVEDVASGTAEKAKNLQEKAGEKRLEAQYEQGKLKSST